MHTRFLLTATAIIISFTSATAYAAPPTAASIEAILSTNGSQQSLESTLAGVEGRMRQEINRRPNYTSSEAGH
jgi:hypothetical protein